MSDPSSWREGIRGHGPLEGVVDRCGLPLTKGIAMPKTDFTQSEATGRLLPVMVWRCPSCGYLELVNVRP